MLDKVTIKEGGWVNVCGHIPLFAQKLGDEPTSRDSVSGIQHFVAPVLVDTPRVPFELIITLPKPRYERNIVERDEFGRIVHAQPPGVLI